MGHWEINGKGLSSRPVASLSFHFTASAGNPFANTVSEREANNQSDYNFHGERSRVSAATTIYLPCRIASFLPFSKARGRNEIPTTRESGSGLAFFVFLMGFGLLMVWLIM